MSATSGRASVSAQGGRKGQGGRASNMALVDSTQQLLEAAMRGSWQRETALTNNVANADTPGYQPQEVNFESALQGAVANGTRSKGPTSELHTPYDPVCRLLLA